MKKLSREEMKMVMGGVYDGGGPQVLDDTYYVVGCTFEKGYSGSFGDCTGDEAGCQKAADDWCKKAENHCTGCKLRS